MSKIENLTTIYGSIGNVSWFTPVVKYSSVVDSKDQYTRQGFPINVLNQVKNVCEVCSVFAATANPVEVIVADNGSSDRTAEKAREAGAHVVYEPERGYGAACLRALTELDSSTDIVVFLDADYSDYPSGIR